MHDDQKQYRPAGYPDVSRVVAQCQLLTEQTPGASYLTCVAQIHNPSKTTTAALLQVFKNNTLAAHWMLRDIAQRRPAQRFAVCRKPNSARYDTDQIATLINKAYRTTICSRYALNSYIFNGLCSTLANMIAAYLRKDTEARESGAHERYLSPYVLISSETEWDFEIGYKQGARSCYA